MAQSGTENNQQRRGPETFLLSQIMLEARAALSRERSSNNRRRVHRFLKSLDYLFFFISRLNPYIKFVPSLFLTAVAIDC